MNPNLSTFKKSGSGNFLGGCGTKDIYTDADGKKWIFKHATPKFASKWKYEPWRIHAQLIASFLTSLLKPDAYIPVYAAKFNGVPGTVQPYLATATPLHPKLWAGLAEHPERPHALDIAREHIADWISSQHDSHSGQWIEWEGRLICTDKEQGYKHFGSDKLSTDYHPNKSYGERPPLYNKFWDDWADGMFKLDMKAFGESFKPLYPLEAAQEFSKLLTDYAKSCPPEFGRDQKFIDAAFKRYMDAKSDFTAFLKNLKG